MLLERKKNLLNFIDTEILRVSGSAQKVKITMGHSLSGYSVAGDMYHMQNAQSMVLAYLERLKKLKKEIEGAYDGISSRVEPVSYVDIKYDDGNILGFYFVKEAVSLPGYLLISKSSPLGKAVFGKKLGAKFTYVLIQEKVKKTFNGSILRIE